MNKNIKLIEKITIVLLVISVLLVIVYLIFNFFVSSDEKKDSKIDYIIEKYNYTLYEKDLEIYKNEFNNLNTILNEKEIDYNKYATSIAKLFIIDFYSLSNKLSSYDVGGTQYLHKDLKDNFILKASNTMYKYINSSNGTKVKEISVTSVEEIEYKYLNKTYTAYKLLINWSYDTDSDYEKEAELILIKDNNQLFIVEKK